MPAKTSPVPPVASKALPVGLMCGTSPGLAMMLPLPLSSTVQSRVLARVCAAAKRSACTAGTLLFNSRAASRGWGVSTVGRPAGPRFFRRWRSMASAAMAFNASASSSKRALCSSTLGSKAATLLPPPQPHTTVLLGNCAKAVTWLRSMISGVWGSCCSWPWSSRCRNTRPAPWCKAALAAKIAAPCMAAPACKPWPPMTSTSPKLPLWLAWRRAANPAVIGAAGWCSQAVGAGLGRAMGSCPRPRSSNQIWPAASRPSAVNRPGFKVSRLRVWRCWWLGLWCGVCGAYPACHRPVSACSPLGKSTAKTVAGLA